MRRSAVGVWATWRWMSCRRWKTFSVFPIPGTRWRSIPPSPWPCQAAVIRLVAAPVFLATKLEAFSGRGRGDYLSSHDLGDFLAVIDGRDSLVDECRSSNAGLRAYLRERVAGLLATSAFIDALPGHLPGDAASQQRLPDLEDKLRALARLE